MKLSLAVVSLSALLLTQACAALGPPPAPARGPAGASPSEGASSLETTSAPRTGRAESGAGSEPTADADAPVTPESIGAKYKADVRKCMHGEPVDGGSMVGGGTCAALRRAYRSGDASELPKGAADAFKEEKGR